MGSWKQMEGRRDKDGYIDVGLKLSGTKIRRDWKAHRLVLEAFVGSCPDGKECRHLNGKPADNRVENLVWDTHLRNEKDKLAHGTTNRGERHGLSKLTLEEVKQIKILYKTGRYSQGNLAKKFGVKRGCICDIVRGVNWAWVKV